MKIKVLDFTAKWCSTCHNLDDVLEKEVIPKYKDRVKFIKIDVEEDEKATNQYDILSVPTLIIFSDSKEIARISSTVSKNEVIEKLRELIK